MRFFRNKEKAILPGSKDHFNTNFLRLTVLELFFTWKSFLGARNRFRGMPVVHGSPQFGQANCPGSPRDAFFGFAAPSQHTLTFRIDMVLSHRVRGARHPSCHADMCTVRGGQWGPG